MNDDTLQNHVHAINICWWLALFIIIALIAGCDTRNAWDVCYDHGDWRETPYCTEAAQRMVG